MSEHPRLYRTQWRRTALALIALALMVSSGSACSGDEAPDLIVYEASDGAATNIYTLDPSSGATDQITESAGFDGNPAWSPDRRRIIFSSKRDGQSEMDLYVMDARGESVRRLTDTPAASEYSAKYSPDGRTIAYARKRGSDWSVWSMAANGGDARQLAGPYAFAEFPAWTPDGRDLYYSAIEEDLPRSETQVIGNDNAYVAFGSGAPHIYSVSVETLKVTTRIRTAGRDTCPHISQDGAQLIYASTRTVANENLGILAHEIDSGDVSSSSDTPLTDTAARNDYPSPSPDGRSIVFASDRDGNTELYVMNADGTSQRRLTTTPGLRENVPNW